MKKTIIIIIISLLAIGGICLLIYPHIEFTKNGKLYSLTYKEAWDEWENNMCFDDSFSYNEKRNITIFHWDLKKFWFFKVFILDYKDGNYCDKDTYFKKDYSEYSFTHNKWIRKNDKKTEVLTFTEDGKFSYCDKKGNPIDGSDLYEYYEYDESKNEITLKSSDGAEIMTLKIVKITEDELKIKIYGENRTFKKEA